MVKASEVPRRGYRWYGVVTAEFKGLGALNLLMSGTIAQWLFPGDRVMAELIEEPKRVGNIKILSFEDYRLWRLWEGEWVEVWPPFRTETSLPRRSIVSGELLYEYRVLVREAISEGDFRGIVELEQYHYASREEVVAVWRCPVCGRYFESNLPPQCPEDGEEARLQEIRGSLPSSRFLIVELIGGRPYEPRILAYVRVDTPIPLMSRRVVEDGRARRERMIRERVFREDWFHPTFWPEAYEKRDELVKRYRELASLYGKKVARVMLGEELWKTSLMNANTAAARIARVVVHPDYRGDGLGVLSVKMALRWIAERRVPEMRRRKHVVETIAQMARYNPFFEKAGFSYVWETWSGRPVLMYPLTDEARRMLESFLKQDKHASRHGGKLYRSRYGQVDPLSGPIVFKNVSKSYSSLLDISGLRPEVQKVLKAFGVEKRLVEKYVLKDVNLEVMPREVVAVIGASGAGKTTLLRLIIGSAQGWGDEAYKPTSGDVRLPGNVRLSYMLPGEREPEFGDETILEHVAEKVGDTGAAVEILSMTGLSDAIFYRARFRELSTGQKERAKLASLLAERPNLLIIDEFSAHLDPLTAMRVARKISKISREAGITLIISTNRPEIIRSLAPDKVIFVGYGRATAMSYSPETLKHL